jgi:hypothetical protein
MRLFIFFALAVLVGCGGGGGGEGGESSDQIESSNEISSRPTYDVVDGVAFISIADNEVKSFYIGSRKKNSIEFDAYVNTEEDWNTIIYDRFVNWADYNLGRFKREDCKTFIETQYNGICDYMIFDEVYEVVVYDFTGMEYSSVSYDNSTILNSDLVVIHHYVPLSESVSYDLNWSSWIWWEDSSTEEGINAVSSRLSDMFEEGYYYFGEVNSTICNSSEKPKSENLMFWVSVFDMCTEGLYDPEITSGYDVDRITVYGFLNSNSDF